MFILPKIHISIERWKWNKSYNIFVSNLGNLKDKDKKDIKPKISGSGYSFIELCNNKKGKIKTLWVHRIVAETWLWRKDMWKEKLTVDHLDHNKRNNSAKNLEWVTSEENCNRAAADYKHLEVDKQIQKLNDTVKNLNKQVQNLEEKVNISAGSYFNFHSWREIKEFLITLNPDYEKTKIETMKKQIRKSARNRTLYCGYIWRIK